MGPFIAVTDRSWFEFLAQCSPERRVDEVNFWSPKAKTPLRAMQPGTPVFLRLKSPVNAIAGYGTFAYFGVHTLDEAWRLFGIGNGSADNATFRQRMGRFRGLDLSDPRTPGDPLGCTVLRDAHFWPKERWIPWGGERGWAANVVRGAEERDARRAALLLQQIESDAYESIARELAGAYQLVCDDERLRRTGSLVIREGQGTFRARLLDAYGRACAVTGEHTEPVLDAAHIQPYLGPASNNVQNGLLLTKEFHALFDLGLVTVTSDYVVRISPAIERQWQNGRRYRAHDGQTLASLPDDPRLRPSPAALDWHGKNLFVA